MLQQPNATQVDIALQTHSTRYSRGQHSSHNQIHNYNTLSNPQDCALQLHWICVTCFDVQCSLTEEESALPTSGFEVL